MGTETIERIKKWLTILDLPSGVIMTVATLSTLGMGLWCVRTTHEIPATFLTLYGLILTPFAIHKTSTAITTIKTDSTEESK